MRKNKIAGVDTAYLRKKTVSFVIEGVPIELARCQNCTEDSAIRCKSYRTEIFMGDDLSKSVKRNNIINFAHQNTCKNETKKY